MKSTVLLVFTLSVALTGASWDFTVSNNKFAASVYKAQAVKADGNFLLSPYSLDAVLTLTQLGAKGETAEEIKKSLFLPEDREEIASTLKHRFANLGQDQPYILRSVNKIYLNNNYLLNDWFRNASEEVFGCEVENVDFSTRVEAADKINKWVEEKTDKKITQLVDSESLSNKTRALLLNTLRFRGKWSNLFNKYANSEDDFYTLDDKVVRVEMMNSDSVIYNYYESAELKAKFLEMPFEGDNASMTIVLPDAKDGLPELEQQIDRVLDTDFYKLELVDLSFPKFRLESKINFKDILRTLGVNKAFEDGEADFSGIAGNPGELFVSDVVQKSSIEIDENGVEASSGSGIIILFNRFGITSKKFAINHPFLFYIKVDDLIVFIGRVTRPLSNELK